MDNQPNTLKDWLPISDFLVEFPNVWHSRKAFDWAQHRRRSNGMDKYKVTAKCGRRILVNPKNCAEWIASGEAEA